MNDFDRKNIYFYSPRSTAFKVLKDHLYINTTPLYLNEFLKTHYLDLAEKINWGKIDFFPRSQKQLVEYIDQHDIDILCISLYIWNINELETIKNIKSKINRPLKIVVGGPSCNAFSDDNFLLENPDVDYAVFAQGEQAFADILSFEIDHRPLSVVNSKNLCWRTKDNKIKKSQFKFVKPGHSSPFLNNRQLLEQIISDPEYANYIFIVPYETSKGCPHSCSFCDWTAGLTHQAGHRTFDIESELDLLGSLGLVTFHPSDANFGQHRQDIEIARTMARLKKQKGYDFFIRDTNLSKTKKDQAFAALEILLEANIVKKAKFAIQDTNELVLKNVDRPDMPWPKHSELINGIRQKFPKVVCEIELILGLPGQTRDTWEQTLIDVEDFSSVSYPWMLLPNAPVGYNKDYREKMGIKLRELKLSTEQTHSHDMVITETYSYNFKDYCYFWLISNILNWKFVADIQPRRKLFNRIKLSQHLDQTLCNIQQGFDSKRPDLVFESVKKFIAVLFVEYTFWDDQTLFEYNKFLDNKNSVQNFWSDTRPKKSVV